ncbi:MAG: hypothetical protein LBJ35_05775 [Spirochaetaceae bacterium]|jgi:hypothetical protein|nr:hypothetical protein [Spirochaetaceae bacterium]
MYTHGPRRRAAQKIFGIFFTTLFINASVFIYAQEVVDTGELQSSLGTVEFIDNTAAAARIDTRQQIFNIGGALGAAVQGGAALAGENARYFVIHRLHPTEFDKLDGDIFGIGPNAGVDTIRNLRLILQAYLQNAYGYSTADADLLAEYITIYNAVYRRNRAYFSGRYKTPLMTDMTEGKEGISTRWDEWAGNTLMLIPLQTAADGSLSAVDTTSITSGEVVDEMRKDADKGIEQRQQMVDLKEREADEAAQKASIQREEVAREEQRIAEQRSAVEEEKQQIAEERAQVPAGTTPAEEAARQAVLDEREAAAASKEAALDAQEDDLEKQRQNAAAAEELAGRKIEEANAERAAISEDQRELIARELGAAANIPPQTAPATGILGIRLNERNSPVGTPVLVSPASGELLKVSGLTTIQARTLVRIEGKILAVAAENSGGVYRVIVIDTTTLQSVKQSEDEINRESLIWTNGANLYAIVNTADGQQRLARFNTDLVRQALSASTVHPFASILFDGNRLITQNTQGAALPLDAQSLE